MAVSLIGKNGKDTLHVSNVCKIGQNKQCCRYLAAGKDGFECAKEDLGFKVMIDVRLEQMTAKADGCEGYKAYQEIYKK